VRDWIESGLLMSLKDELADLKHMFFLSMVIKNADRIGA
jgi:hypothetical protein